MSGKLLKGLLVAALLALTLSIGAPVPMPSPAVLVEECGTTAS